MNGALKVWWIPQIPMRKRFEVSVSSPAEARKVLAILADYDIFQFENKIKPDYSNAGGLMIFTDGEWEDWEDDDGCDIDDTETIPTGEKVSA